MGGRLGICVLIVLVLLVVGVIGAFVATGYVWLVDGISTSATVTSIEVIPLGTSRARSSSPHPPDPQWEHHIHYVFRTRDGTTIQGKDVEVQQAPRVLFSKGDSIPIRYLGYDPQRSRITRWWRPGDSQWPIFLVVLLLGTGVIGTAVMIGRWRDRAQSM